MLIWVPFTQVIIKTMSEILRPSPEQEEQLLGKTSWEILTKGRHVKGVERQKPEVREV